MHGNPQYSAVCAKVNTEVGGFALVGRVEHTGLPGPLHVRGGDEPLPVRLLWRPGARVHVLDADDQPLPEAHLLTISPFQDMMSYVMCHKMSM